ncbi:MAG: peptidylprolyl isomerase [Candidatus Hydrogenedentota bacterium]
MSLEFDVEKPAAARDRTRYTWIAVIAAFVVMVLLLAFVRPKESAASTRVRARHILVKFDSSDPVDRDRAYQLVTELRERYLKGERFAKLARDYSQDPQSAVRGGDLGWFAKGVLTEPVDNYCWSGPIGEISDVIQSSYGFHLVLVEGREISEADRYEDGLEDRAFGKGAPADGGTSVPTNP